MPPDVTAGMEIRPPWPDEAARVREFLPGSFQGQPPAALAVAVHGPVGRFVAVAARVPASGAGSSALLCWRLAAEKYRVPAVLSPLFSLALADAADPVRTAGFLDEGSVDALVLRGQGFGPDAVQQIFELDGAGFYDRLEALHERLAERGLIPAGARVVPLTDDWLPAARHLFAQHVPREERVEGAPDLLGAEHAGYRRGDSYVLLVDGTVRGLLLSRYAGGVSHVGAILVAPELRGGRAWAQVALLRGSLAAWTQNPLKKVRFTADERLHPNSVQFARLWQGRAVGRWVRLRRPVPDTGQNEKARRLLGL